MLANQTITIGDSLLIALVGIAVVLIELALLAVIIMLLSKAIRLWNTRARAIIKPLYSRWRRRRSSPSRPPRRCNSLPRQ